MIWLNAAALAGLLAVVVPLLLHLVARRPAARLLFPTLRFLDAMPLRARARRSLADVPLLLVRGLIVATAVVALAQPILILSARRSAVMSRTVRALVIDTSASMRRQSAATSSSLIDHARGSAARVASAAYGAAVFEGSDLREAMRRAGRWLAVAPPGRQVVTVFTDAQAGTLPDKALAELPSHAGIELSVLEPAPGSVALLEARRVGIGAQQRVESRSVVPVPGGLAVRTVASRADVRCDLRVRVEAPTDVREIAERLRAATVEAGVPCAAPTSPDLVIVFGMDASRPPDPAAPLTPQMLLVLARVVKILGPLEAREIVWARRGQALEAHVPTSPRDAAAGRMVAAAFAAYSAPDAGPEADPRREPDAVIARWSRPASLPPDDVFRNEPSRETRWLWGLVLVLLATETWMRRSPRVGASRDAGGERAA